MGESITAGWVPVPVRATVCGLFGALSVIVRVPVIGPGTEGVQEMLIVQLAPTARDDPQVLVCDNVPLSPLTLMEVMSRVVELLLVRAAVCNALAIPTG